jgi:hypothetical protein
LLSRVIYHTSDCDKLGVFFLFFSVSSLPPPRHSHELSGALKTIFVGLFRPFITAFVTGSNKSSRNLTLPYNKNGTNDCPQDKNVNANPCSRTRSKPPSTSNHTTQPSIPSRSHGSHCVYSHEGLHVRIEYRVVASKPVMPEIRHRGEPYPRVISIASTLIYPGRGSSHPDILIGTHEVPIPLGSQSGSFCREFPFVLPTEHLACRYPLCPRE